MSATDRHGGAGEAELLGASLRAIDGQDVSPLRAVANSLAGGLPALGGRHAPMLFESPQQLRAIGLADIPAAASYRFVLPDGGAVERRLVPDSSHPDRPHADPAQAEIVLRAPPRVSDTASCPRCLQCFASKRMTRFDASSPLPGEIEMNWNRIAGNWKQLTGKAKTQWGKLTDDDLDVIDGRREQLLGKLQERYGVAQDEAEAMVDAWGRRLDADEAIARQL